MNCAKTISLFPSGNVFIPPSKSLSHRAVICAGLAAIFGKGESFIENFGENDDINATLGCMHSLGVEFSVEDGGIRVKKAQPPAFAQTMDCFESGSTLRFMLPVAALFGKYFNFTGSGRLFERPLSVYEKLFFEKGIYFERADKLLRICGPLTSGKYALRGDLSSQFISGLLLALPLVSGESRIILETPLESSAYVRLTLDVMRSFGVTVETPDEFTYEISGGQTYNPARYQVESDYSQAAFFLAAGALGRQVSCLGMSDDSAQGDAEIIDLLRRMGAKVEKNDGTIWATSSGLTAIDADVREIPDLVPPLAVLCALACGTSRITGAARLRDKESDRLFALVTELRKLGADITETGDGLVISGKPQLDGGEVDAHSDHRIAMSLAVAAIRCNNPVTITGWESVQKSYPNFWADFEKEEQNG